MKTHFAIAVLALAMAAFTAGCAGSEDGGAGELRVYNWGEYMDESLLGVFEEQTGISIVYDTYATNEDMYTKIKSGGAQYDIVIPSDYMIEKMINEDMLAELDYSLIPNHKNIDPRFTDVAYDPGGKHSVPYMWGTLGILYNTEMVTDPVDSWGILWNEKYARQIFMYDSMRDTLAVALKRLGYSLNTTDIDELEEAKTSLIAQKPYVLAVVGDLVRDKMIGGEGALGVCYSGDAVYCIEENPSLAYSVPKEGTNVWYDAVVILKDAKNIENAHKFINFLCDGEVALQNTEFVGYSTTNRAAYEMLPDEKQNDPVYWPSDEHFEKSEVFLDVGEFLKEYDRVWTEYQVSG